jgi:hypothetical protein
MVQEEIKNKYREIIRENEIGLENVKRKQALVSFSRLIIFKKCFEVEISGETVTFDYNLRDGITRYMNAGLLMRQMGII